MKSRRCAKWAAQSWSVPTSIEASERLSFMLTQRGIPHDVLNAKQHEREAAIIADAGEPGVVTIATNMAGRGTDIKLGRLAWPNLAVSTSSAPNDMKSRRIDNQLRGRAGRQGDPGSTRFYLSLEDELMRRFGTDRIRGLMERLGMDDETPIEHRNHLQVDRECANQSRRSQLRTFGATSCSTTM